jgi:hypothetical protein
MDKSNSTKVWKKKLRHSSKTQKIYTRLHGAIFQMTVIIIVNAVIISILTPKRSRHTPSNEGTAVHSGTEGHDNTADGSTVKVE